MQTGTPEMGQSKATNEDELMAGWIAQSLTCVVRGIISCFPQVRPEKVLILTSAMFGRVIGQTYAGDELNVMRLRKACRDSFDGAMKNTAVTGLVKDKKADTASVEVG